MVPLGSRLSLTLLLAVNAVFGIAHACAATPQQKAPALSTAKPASSDAVVPVLKGSSVAMLAALKGAELKGDKKTAALALAALARAYMNEDNNEDAKGTINRALTATEEAFGKTSAPMGLVIADQALLSARVGAVADADDQIDRSLKILRAGGEAGWANLARGLMTKAAVQDNEGNGGLAEDTFLEALAILEKHPTSPLLADALKSHAKLLRKLERPDEALKLERRADQLAAAQAPVPVKAATATGSKRGKDTTAYKKAMDEAGDSFKKQDYAGAAGGYRAAINEAKKLGETDPHLPEAMIMLALAQQMNKNNAEAESAYKDAIESRRRIVGPDTPAVAFDMIKLARFYQAQSKWQDAAAIDSKALAIFRKSDLDPARYWDVLNDLVTINNQLKNLSEARDCANQMVAIAERKYGSDSYRYGLATMMLATVYFAEQNWKEGQALSTKAAAIMKDKTPGGGIASDYMAEYNETEKVRKRLSLLGDE